MKLTAMAAAVTAATVTLSWADTASTDVAFGEYGQIEASLTGTPGDPAAGREIMIPRGKGNCIACHQVTAALGDHPDRL